MYVQLDGSYLERTRAKANEEAISSVGEEEGKNQLMYPELKDEVSSFEIEENKISVSFSNELGYFSMEIPISLEDLEQIMSLTIKKLNKIKSLLESLK